MVEEPEKDNSQNPAEQTAVNNQPQMPAEMAKEIDEELGGTETSTPPQQPESTSQEQPEKKEEKETSTEKTTDYTDRERRYYARMKKAEEEAKKVKEELNKTKKESSKPSSDTDVDAILEIQTATKGLSPNEVAELKLRAAALGVSLGEARKDENYLLWQKSYKDKVEKEKALAPSTKQVKVERPKSTMEKLSEAKTLEEKEKILKNLGMYAEPSRTKHKARMDNLNHT